MNSGGYNSLDRQLDKQAAHARIGALRTDKSENRARCEAISIFMQPIIQTEKTKLHCFFCGHPFLEVYNKILYVSAYPAHNYNKVSSDELTCKRCKQRYKKIV